MSQHRRSTAWRSKPGTSGTRRPGLADSLAFGRLCRQKGTSVTNLQLMTSFRMKQSATNCAPTLSSPWRPSKQNLHAPPCTCTCTAIVGRKHQAAVPKAPCKYQCTHPIFSAESGSPRGRRDSTRVLRAAWLKWQLDPTCVKLSGLWTQDGHGNVDPDSRRGQPKVIQICERLTKSRDS